MLGTYNNTIKVHSGKYVNLLDPDPETIDIKDIALALSRICRFGGHCHTFYTVAEHCVHCMSLAILDGCNIDQIAAVLMHDATEAYVGDMVKPLKVLTPEFVQTEFIMQDAIGRRFGIDFRAHDEVVKKYDHQLLKAEKKFFWPNDTTPWAGFDQVQDRDILLPMYPPEMAEATFLNTARILGLVDRTVE